MKEPKRGDSIIITDKKLKHCGMKFIIVGKIPDSEGLYQYQTKEDFYGDEFSLCDYAGTTQFKIVKE